MKRIYGGDGTLEMFVKKHAKASLLVLLVLMFSAFAAACGEDTIETLEVIKEVTKEVEVPVEVIKEVVKEVEVEKIVEKIVEVAPTKEKREIVFGGLNWDSALVQNGVARYIVEHGYGYPTSQIEGSTLPLFQGLRKGDVDLTMEIWLPNQDTAWNEAVKAGEVIPVGKSLEDNWQSSFLIPQYMQDANPELDSIEDLKEDKFKSLFEQEGGKVVLLGCIAGWGCRTMQEGDETGPGQIVGMGLEDHVVLRDPGTAGALAAAIEAAFAKEDPILFYYWGPTALAHQLATGVGYVDLEQPDPSECADNSPIHGCSFPAAEIMIAMNTELVNDAPELISFFQNWDWSAGNQLAAEGWYGENQESLTNEGKTSEEIYSATGVWYLQNNDAWESWVPDDVAANVKAALAKE
ncbi:MAG: glycine betaine ABC transporter substrate-binding protein [Chloroflexota bacterium]|nr:glycine betaine ABC transporter substrate-binding protein [Chloroflexota bacterium]